jgi:hypothetical protein
MSVPKIGTKMFLGESIAVTNNNKNNNNIKNIVHQHDAKNSQEVVITAKFLNILKRGRQEHLLII